MKVKVKIKISTIFDKMRKMLKSHNLEQSVIKIEMQRLDRIERQYKNIYLDSKAAENLTGLYKINLNKIAQRQVA